MCDREFVQFLGIATGSAYELQTQAHIAQRLNLVADKEKNSLVDELLKMIYASKQNIKNRIK